MIDFIAVAGASSFTPIHPVQAALEQSAPAYPGGQFDAKNLTDGNLETEYSSDNFGTNTFVDVSFAQPTRIAAIRHIQRNDPGLVAGSEIEFKSENAAGAEKCRIRHVVKRGAETFYILPHPVVAKSARWRVTELGTPGLGTVGGAELQFFTDGGPVASPAPSRETLELAALPFLEKSGKQKVIFTLFHAYLQPAEVRLQIGATPAQAIKLTPGANTYQFEMDATATAKSVEAKLRFNDAPIFATSIDQQPVPELTLYLVPHSHTDIGYTDLQTVIEEKQVNNLVEGIRLAKSTADYPEGARFVWNVESLWAVDSFLKRRGGAGTADLAAAVRSGQVELTGLYLNLLSGLCRPEELVQGYQDATVLGRRFGVPIETAMISDVPGYTWGGVTAMAQAGIRYFSAGPNYGEKTLMRTWEDRPFYWLGPDGVSRVLVWVPLDGYALSHRYDELSSKLLRRILTHLQSIEYPYDVAYIRWAGRGDNAVPDPRICDFIKEWNATYQSPRLAISGATAPFKALEKKYAARLPVVRGDWTPYWEDGAGSSAFETGLNRQSSDRLTQAQAAYALLKPAKFPAAKFESAWRNVLLYSEHTWGAAESIRDPDSPRTKAQWDIKKSYADQADQESRRLLNDALAVENQGTNSEWFEVINTLSWTRGGLVEVPGDFKSKEVSVTDADGKVLASQQLKSGRLVFWAENVPALGGKRYRIATGHASANPSSPHAANDRLTNQLISVRLDEAGDIVELAATGGVNVVAQGPGQKLNQYCYIRGNAPTNTEHGGAARITVEEAGPLLARVAVESPAPGCRSLRRELQLVAGQDYVEIYDELDKEPLQAGNYRIKSGKESVSIAFPFNVPDGKFHLDIPFATMALGDREQQLAASCTNWFTINRWIDLANADSGITWMTLDAPMVQFDVPAREMDRRHTQHPPLGSTQRFYSWVMNNRWGTNYKARQEGVVMFRYILRPHTGPLDAAEATRLATGFSQPLLIRKSSASAVAAKPLLAISTNNVIVSGIKPLADGKGYLVRLFEAAGRPTSAKLHWGDCPPKALYLSGTDEARGRALSDELQFSPHGVITVRAEF